MPHAPVVIVSTRGFPLALDSEATFPCMAVEMYGKWYGLYLVQGNLNSCTVTRWNPSPKDEDASGSWIFGDHVFNPATLRKCGLPAPIDPRSWELIVGRYFTVCRERDFPEMQAELYHHETKTPKQGS